MKVSFTLNGRPRCLEAEPGRTLLQVLRDDLDLTGTKQACDMEGECGACTVILDGQAVRSCLVPFGRVAGRQVLTIEGLAGPRGLHPVQQAFVDSGAVQCGYCTPGMILAAVALLNREPDPTPEQVREAVEGNLCRCTGYVRIVQAVMAAAAAMRGQALPAADGRPPVGGSAVRVDAVDKVTGAARYAEDIKMPGLLHAALVRCTGAHARLLAIDPAPALALPGVLRVLTAADVPGQNDLEGYSRGEPLFCPPGGSLRHAGEALALVLAESPALARQAAAAVRVETEPLPAVHDPRSALAPGAPQLYDRGNLLREYEIRFGDAEASLARSDLVLETHYETCALEHAALERETVLSYLDDQGRLTVVGGHQEPHWVQGWVARLLALPPERVRVITPPTGGTFGGKQDPWPLMAGALAAYHAPERRPVRLAYTRRESFAASPKRHPYQVDYRVGACQDGTLTGMALRIVADTGAYDSAGYHVPHYALVAGGGPYRWAGVDARARAVHTNNPKSGQMRGYGSPQSTFALECTLDEVALRLGMDPLELRLRNAIDDDTLLFLGCRPGETIGYRQCLEAIRPHYQQARARAAAAGAGAGAWRRGVGLAGMWYRFGKSGATDCHADAGLELDGRIAIFCSAPDYGQGTTTVMSQLAAEALRLPREAIVVVNADTALSPDSGIQGASRSTYWVGGAVTRAACRLRDQVLEAAGLHLGLPAAQLTLRPGKVLAPDGRVLALPDLAAEMDRRGRPRRVRGVFGPTVAPAGPGEPWPEYLPFFVTGAHLAEVEVNLETGQVVARRVVAAHDVGRVINLQGVQGQVEGAILMSLGAALMEEYLPGMTTGLDDYLVPTARCAPDIEVLPVEVPSRWGPLGAKGLGEAAALPTAPALLNAIHDACGARVRRLPATAERVLAAIRAGDRPPQT